MKSILTSPHDYICWTKAFLCSQFLWNLSLDWKFWVFLWLFSANGSFELHLADLHLPLDQFELAHSIERDTQINKQIKTEYVRRYFLHKCVGRGTLTNKSEEIHCHMVLLFLLLLVVVRCSAANPFDISIKLNLSVEIFAVIEFLHAPNGKYCIHTVCTVFFCHAFSSIDVNLSLTTSNLCLCISVLTHDNLQFFLYVFS